MTGLVSSATLGGSRPLLVSIAVLRRIRIMQGGQGLAHWTPPGGLQEHTVPLSLARLSIRMRHG